MHTFFVRRNKVLLLSFLLFLFNSMSVFDPAARIGSYLSIRSNDDASDMMMDSTTAADAKVVRTIERKAKIFSKRDPRCYRISRIICESK